MSATRLSADEQVEARALADATWDDLAGPFLPADEPPGAAGEPAAERRALTWPQTVGFAVAHLVLVAVGRSSVIEGASLSLFWPAAGMAVLWLLAEAPRRQVPVLAMIAAEVAVVASATGAPVLLAGLGSLSVVAQTWLAVALLRRWCSELLGARGRLSVHTPAVLVRVIAAVVLACAVGAAIGMASMQAAGLDPGLSATVLWWGRQVSGILVVGSVGHLVREWAGDRALTRPTGGRLRELAALVVVSSVGVVWVFTQPLPLVFLLVPLSAWCAARFPTVVAAVHATVVGVVALALTVAGLGPFTRIDDAYQASMVTQVLVLCLLVTALLVGTLTDRIHSLLAHLSVAKEHAASQAELLVKVTDGMREGLLVLDSRGEVVVANDASWDLARRLRDSAASGADVLAALRDHVSDALDTGETRPGLGTGDISMPVGPDGQELILAVTRAPLGHGPGPAGAGTLLVLRDVTDHRLGLRPLVDFASTVAHDLRSPLTGLRGWLSVLAEEPQVADDAELKHPVDRAERAAIHMGDLIDDLLQHATAEGGVLTPERLPLDGPDGALAQTVDLLGAADLVRVEHDLPAVTADPGALRQLLANLIGNAVKYVADDVTPQVVVSARREGARVVVTVEDNGIGVPEEDRERIFQRFHRGGSSRRFTGSGIGLSLCRTIVERHEGTIQCLPAPSGTGSVFRFDLPAG